MNKFNVIHIDIQPFTDKYDKMKQWYDGYKVDGISIYNPNSVVEACIRHRFDSYWNKTETYEALKHYIMMNYDGLKEKVSKMIAREEVHVNTDKFQNDMTYVRSADDVLTLLIHLGYLTYDFDTEKCWIPNGGYIVSSSIQSKMADMMMS